LTFEHARRITVSPCASATAEDLFLALLEDGRGVGVHLIHESGGDPARIAATLREKLG
jgi:hypothetical protein